MFWTIVKVYLIYLGFSWFMYGLSHNTLMKAKHEHAKKIGEKVEVIKNEWVWKSIVENLQRSFRLMTRK